ncbi:alpha/beta hydrolase fold [Promicromonospora umidemergens]|uniref:alpha/beta hydrolase n=1 Tax=Promicromonospora umidemergens TaxID=629679 RepID=UPI0020A4A956|nr:alpha/beta hydrolase [Promicromonospora umidemergens]MCP2283210.1 alpha/beta hydrolase fold [Promicromonospora umidemergens]
MKPTHFRSPHPIPADAPQHGGASDGAQHQGRSRRARRRGVALLTVLGLAGTLAVPAAADVRPDGAEPGGEPAAQVEWGACPADVAAGAVPYVLTCASVPVPLDYSDPDGEQITIEISRMASDNPAERRGVLLLNPGGPGGSGLTQSTLLASQGLPDTVLDAYDLIGMDTRGVGHSTRVDCEFTVGGDYFGNVPPYAVDDAAVVERAKVVEAAAEQCAANDENGLLRHVSTANMARDLDSIRAALGEEKASFLGYSYGSSLGAAYASMFPGTADRVVLDSIVGDTHLDREGLRRFAQGMEQTFPDFARWAAKRDTAYGLGRTPAQVRADYFETAEQLDRSPVQGVDGTLFRQVVFVGLYSERSYGRTAQAWQSLRAGDGAAARSLLETDLFEGVPSSGTVPSSGASSGEVSPISNALSVFLATTCNDVEWPEDVNTYRKAVAEDRKKFPLFGAASANIVPCAYWPEPIEPPVQVAEAGRSNVLILQNRRDPVTPLAGGKQLHEKFGDRSRLVTVDGSGHGVYVLGGNACALNVATTYLVDGEMPRRDVSCRAA